MAENDVILLNSILEEQKTNEESESSNFEIFVFDQLLKNFDLSHDEIKSGKVGGGDDGGIDGLFFFLNGDLVLEEVDKNEVKKNPTIDLFIIQTKRSTSFDEDVFNRFSSTVSNIFDLTKDIDKLKNFYNINIIEKSIIFRSACVSLASKYPKINIRFYYATKGSTENIHHKVKNKAEELKQQVEILFSGCNTSIEFFGARNLLELSRTEKTYTLSLEFTENFSKGENDYVVLCGLINYYNFVTDEFKKLRKYIFESNVRDYQGDVEVNKDIKETLSSGDPTDFWWLNNGITIIATKANVTGKTIVLDDVQIVNGLQTTRCVYNYFCRKEQKAEDNKKSILVRIIISNDSKVRDKIIKATNFQTRIPDASLRATDTVQRNIEEFLKMNGWYYDRRKNYYKNIGKHVSKIISIPYLAQSVTALLLKEPHISRGRPTSITKKDEDYIKVFDSTIDLQVYLNIIKIMKKVEDCIRKDNSNLTIPEKTNFRFHIAVMSIISMFSKQNYTKEDLINLDLNKLTQNMIDSTITLVINSATKYANEHSGTIDSIAKAKSFSNFLFNLIKK